MFCDNASALLGNKLDLGIEAKLRACAGHEVFSGCAATRLEIGSVYHSAVAGDAWASIELLVLLKVGVRSQCMSHMQFVHGRYVPGGSSLKL